ncbi:MAG: ATPase, partial [Candidatus Zixiibacteriota bacterium]
FDCRIGHLKDFMYMEILGMTERDDFYAKMVRENLMTREEALLRLQKENRLHLAHIQPLLREVGIDCTAVLEKQRM